jgi:hypothetical protein
MFAVAVVSANRVRGTYYGGSGVDARWAFMGAVHDAGVGACLWTRAGLHLVQVIVNNGKLLRVGRSGRGGNRRGVSSVEVSTTRLWDFERHRHRVRLVDLHGAGRCTERSSRQMTQPPQWGSNRDDHEYGSYRGEDQPTARNPRIDDVPPSPPHMPTQQPQPIPQSAPPPPPPSYGPPPGYGAPMPPQKNSNAAVWVVVALLAVVVLGLVGYIWLWPQIVNDDAASGPSTSTSTVVVPAPGVGPAPAQGGGPAPAAGDSVPAYSTPCASVFSSPSFGRSAVGSSVTSCEFAEEVRASYLRQGIRNGAVSVDAYSPVTGRTYTMNCSGNTVVTCTGGNDAVVYLY